MRGGVEAQRLTAVLFLHLFRLHWHEVGRENWRSARIGGAGTVSLSKVGGTSMRAHDLSIVPPRMLPGMAEDVLIGQITFSFSKLRS